VIACLNALILMLLEHGLDWIPPSGHRRWKHYCQRNMLRPPDPCSNPNRVSIRIFPYQ
jgi:hypothetical protein